MNIKNILVPTDFSECSKNAVQTAVTIAKKFNAKIWLMHAYTMPVMASDTGIHVLAGDRYDFEGDSRDSFKDLKEDLTGLQDVDHEELLICDFTKDAVLNSAKNNNVNLIVMGTVGAGGIEEMLIGSNTYAIISENKYPLLAVPADASMRSIKKIVFAGDYLKIPSGSVVLNPLKYIARQFGAEIHILHVGNRLDLPAERSEEARKLDREFKNIPHHYHLQVSDDVEEGINAYVDDNSIDLVTVVHRHHNFIDRIFKGSWTRKMALHCNTPLLVLPEIVK